MCVYVTERYMEMHMKHEHRDAHLCVCVSWRVMWGGGKPEEEYPPQHPSCLSSPLLKEGGALANASFTQQQNTLMPSTFRQGDKTN